MPPLSQLDREHLMSAHGSVARLEMELAEFAARNPQARGLPEHKGKDAKVFGERRARIIGDLAYARVEVLEITRRIGEADAEKIGTSLAGKFGEEFQKAAGKVMTDTMPTDLICELVERACFIVMGSGNHAKVLTKQISDQVRVLAK